MASQSQSAAEVWHLNGVSQPQRKINTAPSREQQARASRWNHTQRFSWKWKEGLLVIKEMLGVSVDLYIAHILILSIIRLHILWNSNLKHRKAERLAQGHVITLWEHGSPATLPPSPQGERGWLDRGERGYRKDITEAWAYSRGDDNPAPRASIMPQCTD